MAMMLGNGPHRGAEINVTPMIDVLLVLIIIFLVIQPSRSTGLDTLVPQESQAGQASKPLEDIVITVLRDEAVTLNEQRVDLADLEGRLKDVLRRGAKPVLFVRAEEGLEFGRIAQVIDIGKARRLTGSLYCRVKLCERTTLRGAIGSACRHPAAERC